MVLRKKHIRICILFVLLCVLIIIFEADLRKVYAEETPKIQSIEITYLSKDTYLVEEQLDLNGSKITVTYEDETTETLEITDDYYVYDSYGNLLEYDATFLAEEGELEELWVTGLNTEGTYEIIFFYYDADDNFIDSIGTGAEIKVCAYTVSNIGDVEPLTVGETYSAYLDAYEDMIWFSFTPSAAGLYIFKSTNNVMENDWRRELYSTLYQKDENGKLTELDRDDAAEDFDFYQRYYLEEGSTYYYRVKTYNLINFDGGSFDVQLLEGKEVRSISVEELSRTEFVQVCDELDLTGTVLTITYTDGSSAETIIDGNCVIDEYDNQYNYYICNQEEMTHIFFEEALILPTGVYSVTFVSYHDGDTFEDSEKTVEIISLENTDRICEIENLDEEVGAEMKGDRNIWFSYTSDKDGWYYINVRSNIDEEDASWMRYAPFYIDEDGNCVDAQTMFDTSYEARSIYRLEEGVTYYIGTTYYEDYSNEITTVYVDLQLQKAIVKNEVTIADQPDEDGAASEETDMAGASSEASDEAEMADADNTNSTSEEKTGVVLGVIAAVLLIGAAAAAFVLAKKKVNA